MKKIITLLNLLLLINQKLRYRYEKKKKKSNQFLLRWKKQVLRSPFQQEYDNAILLYFFTHL